MNKKELFNELCHTIFMGYNYSISHKGRVCWVDSQGDYNDFLDFYNSGPENPNIFCFWNNGATEIEIDDLPSLVRESMHSYDVDISNPNAIQDCKTFVKRWDAAANRHSSPAP